jgi:hypothetical protein
LLQLLAKHSINKLQVVTNALLRGDLRPLTFLPPLAAFIAGLRRRDRLATDGRHGRGSVPAFGLADGNDQDSDDLLSQAAVAPSVKAVLLGGKRREGLRQQTPGAASADHVERER